MMRRRRGRGASPLRLAMRRWRSRPAAGQTTTSRQRRRDRRRYNAGVERGVRTPPTPRAARCGSPTPATGTPSTRRDTYYAYSWNFVRLYGRSLVVFKSAPGAEGSAARPGPRRGARHAERRRQDLDLQAAQGIKFEDGTPVTSQGRQVRRRALAGQDDVPERARPTSTTTSTCRATRARTRTPARTSWASRRSRRRTTRRSSSSCNKPFSGFDYFAQLPATIPVPQAKDTGAKYKEQVVSTGPYMFETNELGKQFTLVRNPNWDPATDPNRKALPDRIEVTLNVNADDIDNRLIAGDLDVDIEGTGVQPAAQGQDPGRPEPQEEHRLRAARPGRWFTALNSEVAPLDNIECRKAVHVRRRQDRLPARLRRPARRRHRHEPAAPGDPGRGEVRHSTATPKQRR